MKRLSIACVVALLSPLGCGDDSSIQPEGGSAQGGSSTSDGGAGAAGAGGQAQGAGGSGGEPDQGGSAPCPSGVTCVTSFPFSEQRDTSAEGGTEIDAYDCSPGTNEGGPEILYRVTVPSDGFVSAAVYDDAGVDIDVHIVTTIDPLAPSGDGCLSRGDLEASADVSAGDVWIVADTWVNGGGSALSGGFRIDIGFVPVSSGPCGMQTGELARVGDGGVPLAMPATGPVVKEAHLVTQAEPKPYPSTATEELAEHYALSQTQTGLVMHRSELWAPMEGGSFFGAGIGSPSEVPVVDEGWYVNMYWTPASRPPRGTRMILRRPDDPTRAVVVSAGHETGPGNLAKIGGTTEESHFYLGTEHDSALVLGFAVDQALPFGPRRCTD
ncbi:MAG: hypothetical protein IPM79_06025 [Polyangiaceae bacterium]|jgi:hypothetical protein|nr:hypothetical protein [Polyangiaceae bacterium]